MMRKRHALAGAGILAAAVGLAGASASWPSASMVRSLIRIFPAGHMVFAPPPQDAAPAMTWPQVMTANHLHFLGSDSTVRLGLFNRQLVYGVSTPVCPAVPGKPEGLCTAWEFFDANTGRFVRGSEAGSGNGHL